MSQRSATYLIMTLVAIIVICGIVACARPAHAGRGCLEREEAKRIWPTKTLGIDDDGCWTYMRRGINPPPKAPIIDVPIDIITPPRAAVSVETAAGLDLLQRWPTVTEIELKRYEPFVETEPFMTARNMWTAVFSVVLFCAVLEVVFGGKVLPVKKGVPPWSDR